MTASRSWARARTSRFSAGMFSSVSGRPAAGKVWSGMFRTSLGLEMKLADPEGRAPRSLATRPGAPDGLHRVAQAVDQLGAVVPQSSAEVADLIVQEPGRARAPDAGEGAAQHAIGQRAPAPFSAAGPYPLRAQCVEPEQTGGGDRGRRGVPVLEWKVVVVG